MNSVSDYNSRQEFVVRVSQAAHGGFSITPSDAENLSQVTVRGIYVGGTGDIVADMMDGTNVTFKSVPVGLFPIAAKKIYATGTTATNLVGLY